MKVFINDCLHNDERIFVAANNKAEAQEILMNEDKDWASKYSPCNWREVNGLKCDTDEPCVIDM